MKGSSSNSVGRLSSQWAANRVRPFDTGCISELKGTPTAIGAPANMWLLDFVALSSLRLSLKNYWEHLVKDIVRKRNQTRLTLVDERLGLTISEVLDIANKIRNLDDRVIEHDSTDSGNDLTYICREPDPSLTPPVDIDM